jgi:hypothetical protein
MTARLVGISADTADHPFTAARAFGLLGLAVAVHDDVAEISPRAEVEPGGVG